MVVELEADLGGKIFPHVFPGGDQLGALFNQLVRSPGALVGDVAGDSEQVAVLVGGAAGP
jgi:hypothetical protein